MASLLDLSDELLLSILSQLDTCSLVQVKSVCRRLESLTLDHTLWHDVNLSKGYFSRTTLAPIVAMRHFGNAESFQVRGLRNTNSKQRHTRLLSDHIVVELSVNAPKLKHFTVREAVLCAKELNMQNMALYRNLVSLSLIDCEFLNKPHIVNSGSWFKKLHTHLPNLECLQVCGTSFIDDHDMLAIGKARKLKKLVLTNCIRVGIAIPYLAIAFRFGFQSLEHLDLRGTSMQNNDVQSILQPCTLKKLYLGPMGRVKRQSANPESLHNLIMPDPRRDHLYSQQVLVINMGPNGPNCRQAQDHELDALGLGWVRNQNQSRRIREDCQDEHMFIGENGNILHPDDIASSSSDGCSTSCKRKAEDCEDENGGKKKIRLDPGAGPSDTDDYAIPCKVPVKFNMGCLHEYPEDIAPDEELSDLLVAYVAKKRIQLKLLHLAGCAITNNGLLELLKETPTLEYVNVMYTYVTQDYVELLRKEFVHCTITDVIPPPRKAGECTIFCSP